MAAYGEDLAYIHDVGFGGFAAGAAPGLLRILRDAGIADGWAVDLGCGSGLWARELCDAGFRVLGIDLSESMVEIARRRAPQAEFRVGSFLDIDLPPCSAVTAIGECFNYLFDERNGVEMLGRLFGRVHDALADDGMFVFDVAEPGRGVGPRQRHWEGEDWATLVEVEEDPKLERLTRRITTFRRVNGLYRRGCEVHHQRLYRGCELGRMLRGFGFRVRLVRGYGAFRFPPACVGLVARKA